MKHNQERMNFENKKADFLHSKVVKAGSRRTYFIDVKPGKRDDYCIVITESRKMIDYGSDKVTYDKNRIYLYKEDFNKFARGLNEVIDHVKTNLLPDYDFDTFDKPLNPENSVGSQRVNNEESNEQKDAESDDEW